MKRARLVGPVLKLEINRIVQDGQTVNGKDNRLVELTTGSPGFLMPWTKSA
jgi:hypothetical protein